MKKLEVVILAAGQGKRMKSARPKVLHAVAGKPMLQHVIDTAKRLGAAAIHVVIGHGGESVSTALQQDGVNWVQQAEQLGTGHAVLQVLPQIDDDSTVLVLYGDVPLITAETLTRLVSCAESQPALLTARVSQPQGLGRILRDSAGALLGVVEDKDADVQERAIMEINSGVLAASARQLKTWLPQVRNNNQQGEYYLPDVLSLAVAAGIQVHTTEVEQEVEILGINTRAQLNIVEREYQRRIAQSLMCSGVTLADAARIDVRGELETAEDVFIDVNAVFEGKVKLGIGVRIGANCVLIDADIGAGSEIKAFSHLQEVLVGRDCAIGPYARLRPGTQMEEGAKVGNFVETKKAHIGAGSKVSHLSYIGDAELGAGVNVGAGTITCNYDGVNKYRTHIGDGAFIGSNTTLVAPVEIRAHSFVAAGSTITKTVGVEQLAVGRAKQRNISGWRRPREEDKE